MVVCRSSGHELSRRASKTVLRVVTSVSDGAASISNQMSRNIYIFGFLFLGFLTAGGLQAQNAGGVLLTTVTNPTLAASERFGSSVAALGSDRVLVGASSAGNGGAGVGAAYLVALDGRLVSSFTNPTPASGDYFGIGVASLGNEGVLVGAWGDDAVGFDSGSAYLFNTNGTLVMTFTNPTPEANDMFGYTLAGLGNDRVLVGAYGDRTNLKVAGAAYLFATNGSLLATFGSPSPVSDARFGSALCAIGTDRVLIGAPGDSGGAPETGAAYLFGTNGTLLTVFTNPTPARFDNFGFAVAAVGNDRVVVSATWDSAGAVQSGSVYVFDTNGVLLTTITNPTPGISDNFGWSVAAVGKDRILVGSRLDDTGATNAGAAYLVNTTGTLLFTLTNPTPFLDDIFGWAVASIGADRLIVSASLDDTVATDSGTVYLFGIPYPPLGIERNASTVSISWAWPETGLILQQTGLLGAAADWKDAAESVSVSGQTNLVQQSLAATNRFYRLRKP